MIRSLLILSVLIVLGLGAVSLIQGWQSDHCTGGNGTYTCTKQDGSTYTWRP